MSYAVHEIFYSLQGEGANAGRPAIFCRFAGCNLWSGRETDRTQAVCRFCDTEFRGTHGVGGGRYASADELAMRILDHWPDEVRGRPFVVITGGEPALQLDCGLIARLREADATVAIETNGTLPLPEGLDWICVSPKAGAGMAIEAGDELKLVFPQDALRPDELAHLSFQHFFLQPMDGPELAANTQAALDYCLENPPWRLSLQLHKVVGIQ